MADRPWTTWTGRALAVTVAWLVPFLLIRGATGGEGGTPVSSATAFLDSVGVQTHGDFLDTAYADAARVERAVTELGIRHVRDGITSDPRNERHLAFLERLGRAGIRLNLTIDEPRAPGAPIEDRLAVVRERLLPYTETLEGPNEKDMGGDPRWPERVRDYQRELYDKAKADPALRRIPVLGPSLGRNGNQPALGDLRGMADWANLHSYPGALPPSRPELQDELAAVRDSLTGAPLAVTETGYHNAWQEPRRQPFTPERVAGAYYPRLLLEHFTAGVRRTFAYELLDEKPDPGGADQEQHFGLLRNDFSPKPAAEAVRRLLALARGPEPADERPGDGSGALDLEVRAPVPVRRLVLRRSDGRLLVLLWQTAALWDRDARRELEPAAADAQVRLGATFGAVDVHRIASGETAPPRRLGARRALEVSVPAREVVGLVLGAAPDPFPLPFLLPPRRRSPGRSATAPPADARREPDADADPARL